MSAKLKTCTALAVLAAGLSGTVSWGLAQAGTIVQCGTQVCSSTFRVDFENTEGVGTGEGSKAAIRQGSIEFSNTDPESITGPGVVTPTGGIMWTMGDGSTISVGSLTGNADPILDFGVGASTGSAGHTFGLTFNLPVAIAGTITANSSVSYTLTSTTTAGAQITAPGTVVSAFEVDTDVGGLGFLNKGVDVGNTFGFLGGPLTQNSPVYTASNTFTGSLAYDLMSVQIDFGLSPDSSVGISGFVNQVPIPAAVWLFGSGLIGLIVIARKRA